MRAPEPVTRRGDDRVGIPARRACRRSSAGRCSTPTNNRAHPPSSSSATACGSGGSADARMPSVRTVQLGSSTVDRRRRHAGGLRVSGQPQAVGTASAAAVRYAPLEGVAVQVFGRLAPGATRQQANAELAALTERAAAVLPRRTSIFVRACWPTEAGLPGEPALVRLRDRPTCRFSSC